MKEKEERGIVSSKIYIFFKSFCQISHVVTILFKFNGFVEGPFKHFLENLGTKMTNFKYDGPNAPTLQM